MGSDRFEAARPRPFYKLSYIAFVLFAVTAMWGPAGPYLMLIPLLAWFVYWSRREGGSADRSSLVWLVCLFLFYVGIRAVFGYMADPTTWEQQDKVAADYFRIGGLWAMVLAPWLVGRSGQFNRNILFGLALVGFLGETLFVVPWGDIATGAQVRPNLVSGPNGSAVVSGFFFLLVLIVGGSLIVSVLASWRWWASVSLVIAWLALLGLLALYLALMQSRSAWLALAAVLPLVVVAGGWVLARASSTKRIWVPLASLAVAVAIVAGVFASQHHLIERRYEAAKGPVKQIVALEWDQLEPGSLSYRIWMYQFGVSRVLEKPLFGWSPGGVKKLIQEKGGEHIDRFSQIHNMHLEVALGLGGVGLILFYSMVAISFTEVVRAMRRRRLPFTWGLFWIAATLFIGIEALFDTRFFVYDYGAVMVLLGTLAIGCQLDRLGDGCDSADFRV
jgi:O-antigen ligase